jgi:hypothetical protein
MGMIGATIGWAGFGGAAPRGLRVARGTVGGRVAFLGNDGVFTGLLVEFAGCAACLRRSRRRFFPVGPVALSKVTESSKTGGVIGTLSRSAADSLGGTS